jgi:hypothetical protein
MSVGNVLYIENIIKHVRGERILRFQATVGVLLSRLGLTTTQDKYQINTVKCVFAVGCTGKGQGLR